MPYTPRVPYQIGTDNALRPVISHVAKAKAASEHLEIEESHGHAIGGFLVAFIMEAAERARQPLDRPPEAGRSPREDESTPARGSSSRGCSQARPTFVPAGVNHFMARSANISCDRGQETPRPPGKPYSFDNSFAVFSSCSLSSSPEDGIEVQRTM
jgi:hypothetical protein